MIFLILLATCANIDFLEPDLINGDTLSGDNFNAVNCLNPMIYSLSYEWDAEQGDSLITSGIPFGNNTNFKVYIKGAENLIVAWYVKNDLPINEWSVVIPNTGNTHKLYRTFNPMNKFKFFIGLRARTTELRTIKIWVVKYRRPYD